MGVNARFPRRNAADLALGRTLIGAIETDAVAALTGSVSGTAQTTAASVTITLAATTLSAPAAVGATSVTLTSTAGYANGSDIRIAGAGQGGTSLGGGDLIAKITLSGSVASLFDPITGVPMQVQTAVLAGAVVMPGFLAGDYVTIAGGGVAAADLVTTIVSVNPAGTALISARPGLPTTVSGAVMTRHYKVPTNQIARHVVLRRLTGTLQIDEWDDTMEFGAGLRTSATGDLTVLATGGMLVLPSYIVIPPAMLPASSSFALSLTA